MSDSDDAIGCLWGILILVICIGLIYLFRAAIWELIKTLATIYFGIIIVIVLFGLLFNND